MNMFYMLKDSIDICDGLSEVWTIFGYIVVGIQIVVPLLLIISGMITMAKAVMEKKEDDIKKAQNLLVKKIIAAVIAFLVITIVKIVVPLVADKNWESCAICVFEPFKDEKGCGITKGHINIPGTSEDDNNEDNG